MMTGPVSLAEFSLETGTFSNGYMGKLFTENESTYIAMNDLELKVLIDQVTRHMYSNDSK